MGRKGGTRVLGLPGNPVSAMLTFLLFAAPLLRALEGERDPLPKKTHARLSRDVKHHPGRTEFLRATLSQDAGDTIATPISSQSSGSIVSMAWADALIVVPRDATGLAKDTVVEIIRL
jgi:molybdopterin molybdotransferase